MHLDLVSELVFGEASKVDQNHPTERTASRVSAIARRSSASGRQCPIAVSNSTAHTTAPPRNAVVGSVGLMAATVARTHGRNWSGPLRLGRTRARCPGYPESVSRARPPNRTCDSRRIRLSTCLARCLAAGDSLGPGSRDVRSAIAVADHRDAGGAGELDSLVGDPPAPAAEATSELLQADMAVLAA